MIEFLTVCVALAAVTAYAWWATTKWYAAACDLDEAIEQRDAARACRDAAKRERDRAASACESLRGELANLRTVHKLDPDETWEQRLVDLTKQADDAVALAHAEQLRRVEAERAVCDWMDALARGEALGRLVLDADAEPTAAPVVSIADRAAGGQW